MGLGGLAAGNAGHALDLWPKWNIEIQYRSLVLCLYAAKDRTSKYLDYDRAVGV